MAEVVTIMQLAIHCLLAYVCMWMAKKLGLDSAPVPMFYFMAVSALLLNKYNTLYINCMKDPKSIADNVLDYLRIKRENNNEKR